MERKRFALKIKAVDDTGTFTGMGRYNNTDLGGDRSCRVRSRARWLPGSNFALVAASAGVQSEPARLQIRRRDCR